MKTELLVIGAGTAGLRTALTAAKNGTKTVLVGDGPIAGTCLNNGCIPTKTMLHAADVYRTVLRAKEIGITASAKIDFKKIMNRVRDISKEGREHALAGVHANKNLTYIEGRACFVAEKTVEVNHDRITANKIIIATGTSTSIPPIPGLTDVPYITNVEAVELTKPPKHLILLGGGYIACEYATFFATLGIKVSIVERAPSILTVLDDDMRSIVQKSLEDMGVRIFTNVATTNVVYAKNTFTLSLAAENIKRISGDMLLVATGRKPNTSQLGLEDANVRVDAKGYVSTNLSLRTSNPHIYAIGDVNGQSLFAHTAKRESWLALEHALLDKQTRMEYDAIPWAVFTHPVVAGVGKTESQLHTEGISYDVLEASFSATGKAKVIREQEGKVKILHKDGALLGACIAGPDADNLIHELAALMHAGKQAMRILQKTVHAHPTLAEVFESLHPRS